VYRTPADWLLIGVHGEGSGFDRDRVHVSTVYMPLFVPRDHLSLGFGRRVPNGTATFGLRDGDAFTDALQRALSELPTTSRALELIAESTTEESAYAALLMGDTERAERVLDCPFADGDNRRFVEHARERQRQVRESLRSGGTQTAQSLLRAWRDHTAAALRVA
jgi:hypothetical protein